ncbi:MAG TPA: hypothetical protein VLY20_02745 [Nitrospiria bacterium]|nr:hypothetical protein [Nitrospiria bacterium]
MVQKIRKKTKKGPKAPHAVPLAIVLTALYGIQREGRDFRRPFEDPAKVRAALRLQLEQEIIPSDRVLSFKEYREWGLKNSPGRLVEMFSRTGFIPMGPAGDEEGVGSRPRLGILPIIAVVKGMQFESFGGRLGGEWSEVAAVAFQNGVYPAFNLIAGYDLLLYRPPHHARDINRSVAGLNQLTEEAFHQAGRPYPGPFDFLPDEVLSRIPLEEPLAGGSFGRF